MRDRLKNCQPLPQNWFVDVCGVSCSWGGQGYVIHFLTKNILIVLQCVLSNEANGIRSLGVIEEMDSRFHVFLPNPMFSES